MPDRARQAGEPATPTPASTLAARARLRVAFAGTPEFAATALAAILAAGFHVPLVLTRADKPAGRGKRVQSSPVKQLALAAGIAVDQPRSLREPSAREALAAARPDVLVVAAYGLILPAEVLALPRLGCVNIHASLLPRWRGAAPIQRAIVAGDVETGITIMQMDEGLDTGPTLMQRGVAIRADDTGGSVHDRLAALGAVMVVEALDALAAGHARPVRQPAEGVTYAHKITRGDAVIDWSRSASEIADTIRAFDPAPGATACLEADPPEVVKIWRARVIDLADPGLAVARDASPGDVLAASGGRLVVACRAGALEVLELQRPGGRRLSAAEFLRGRHLAVGARFAGASPG